MENGFVLSAISNLTCIEVHGLTMYFNFDPVEFTSCELAVDEFLAWLKNNKSPLLVVHNADFSPMRASKCSQYAELRCMTT